MAAIINVIDMYKQRSKYKKHIQFLIEEKLNNSFNSFHGYGPDNNIFVENHVSVCSPRDILLNYTSWRTPTDYSRLCADDHDFGFDSDNNTELYYYNIESKINKINDWSEFYCDE